MRVTSAVSARSFARMLNTASSRDTCACWTRSSRAKLSNNGTESDALSEIGERWKLKGNWLLRERIASAMAGVNWYAEAQFADGRPTRVRMESAEKQSACWLRMPACAWLTR